jgi:DNA-binding transcriptional ArsR family regulator
MSHFFSHGDIMLEPLFGTANREKALIFLEVRTDGYPREIADLFDTDLRAIQNQLEKLERGGVVYSRMVGRTRLYSFNPRYPFLVELKALLEKALEFYPQEEKDRLFPERSRPRRKGKPL